MFRQGFAAELRWFVFLLSCAALVGYIFDYPPATIIVFLLGYIAWLFIHINRIEDWIISVRHSGPQLHSFGGVWAEIADEVTRLHNLYQKDKQRLQSVVSRVQSMTSALEDGVVLIDKRSNIEWWNTNAAKFIEFQDMDRGHRLENIIRHPRFIQYFEGDDFGEPLEIEGLRREGQFLEFRVHPFGQGERLVVIREITRVRKLEQMRKDFVANVSHELRTPLTVIRGYIETMIDMPGLPGPLEKALGQMQQQGQRMTNLINDLITLSRLETDSIDNNLEYVGLTPLVDTILSDARAIASSDDYIFKSSGLKEISILGSASQLRSAISNLVFNAVKYSPPGSTIEVNVALVHGDAVVNVIDNGTGIDSKHLPRLTERFYRVDDGRAANMGGTGLGLAIVKHVLLRHDAELKITSRLGSGSTFSCYFPQKRIKEAKVSRVERTS